MDLPIAFFQLSVICGVVWRVFSINLSTKFGSLTWCCDWGQCWQIKQSKIGKITKKYWILFLTGFLGDSMLANPVRSVFGEYKMSLSLPLRILRLSRCNKFPSRNSRKKTHKIILCLTVSPKTSEERMERDWATVVELKTNFLQFNWVYYRSREVGGWCHCFYFLLISSDLNTARKWQR